MEVLEKQEYGTSFRLRSRGVIYDIIGMSRMSHDVRQECLEYNMKSQKYLECHKTSEKNVTSQ